MIALSVRRAAAALTACLALITSAACTDLPTGVDSFQLEADGQLWTAVMPPADLPTASTWLAFGEKGSAQAARVAAEVAALQEQAAQARVDGDLERADALLARAAAHAIDAMDRDPGPGPFLTALASLNGWERRVGSAVDLARAPGLAPALEAVARDREAAEAAFMGGDSRSAAVLITRASERVRDWAPQGIALRVLDRAVGYLAAADLSEVDRERVDHLVRSAREELVRGEPLGAAQRALYALQLAQGNGLPEVAPDHRARCGEFSC